MKLLSIVTISLVIFHQHVENVESAKILCIFHTMAKSHFMIGEAVAKNLLNAGHEITVISPFPQKNPLNNWRDIETK